MFQSRFRIGHDNKGGFAGWMLDRVEIETPSIEKRLYFPCGRWLDKKEDDGLIERELFSIEKGTFFVLFLYPFGNVSAINLVFPLSFL